jgi:GNAT superfamily N-acetyltransferase
MAIRSLKRDEIALCFSGGYSFYEELGLPGNFSEEVFLSNWYKFYDLGWGVILGDFSGDELNGAIGGVVSPDACGGDLMATELFWFVFPGKRGSTGIRLLRAFEDWAKENGAERIRMSARSERPINLLERVGYRREEVLMIKEIGVRKFS